MSRITVTLPEPPSANRWWRNVNGRMVTSRQARDYKRAVYAKLLLAHTETIKAPQPVGVRIAWYRGRRAGDLDKRVGVLLDALQGTAFDSDAQVIRLEASRHDDKANPRVEVTIEAVA